MAQLKAMSAGERTRTTFLFFSNSCLLLSLRHTEERQVREDFNAEHGAHIPADICLCIENPPTRWEVLPCAGDVWEVLPEIDADLVTQVCRVSFFFFNITFTLFKAREKLIGGEGVTSGSDSL